MDYTSIKYLHITMATLSGSLFLLRGIWMLRESSLLAQRWVRIVPHVVDTLLLASALTMVIWSEQYPFVQSWLTAKVLALIVYIGLGAIALKYGKTKTVRVCALVSALTVILYIAAVAVTKRVLVFV